MRGREERRKQRGRMDGVSSPGTVMVHAAYAPLTDSAVMRSGRSVGLTAAAHGPTLTALKTAARQVRDGHKLTEDQPQIIDFPDGKTVSQPPDNQTCSSFASTTGFHSLTVSIKVFLSAF